MDSLTLADYELIESLCIEGNQFMRIRKYSEAMEKYWQAWGALPEPKSNQEVSLWILLAMSDIHFTTGDYEACKRHLSTALTCPGGRNHPVIYLRLGQCHYELNHPEGCRMAFERAHHISGDTIFKAEHPKYLAFFCAHCESEKWKVQELQTA